ncbi:MAG: (2Fe-2S)-binding protein [Limnothrix sp. RL_2_0]|nr:(2Fe-2S)-binding protein [Limnothrix sp. RL_2_0]
MNKCLISFPNSIFPSISLEKYDVLSEKLTVQNSPILFGCRTGLCGTCLVAVTGDIPLPKVEEMELLEILAPNDPQARLACQIELTTDIAIATYG